MKYLNARNKYGYTFDEKLIDFDEAYEGDYHNIYNSTDRKQYEECIFPRLNESIYECKLCHKKLLKGEDKNFCKSCKLHDKSIRGKVVDYGTKALGVVSLGLTLLGIKRKA